MYAARRSRLAGGLLRRTLSASAGHGGPTAVEVRLADEKRRKLVEKTIRVDHAGEFGARQIYAGQLAVFRGTSLESVLQEMQDQEKEHLDAFNKLIIERRVRPTALLPLWRVAGFGLGYVTALMGKESAMACTVAVEEVIARHYTNQAEELGENFQKSEEALIKMVRQFAAEELEHYHTGIEYDAQSAPFYHQLARVIKAGCHAAIVVTEKV